MTEARYVRFPDATIQDLREALENLALSTIEANNPGIDMDEVKLQRAQSGIDWTELD